MARQLALDLSRGPCFDADDFLVSPSNEAAVAVVHSWQEWPAHSCLLIGPAGSGKSHLAHIWAQQTGAVEAGCDTLVAQNLWAGGARMILVEDCDRGGLGEADLFHLFNLARETNGRLLMTARTALHSWGLQTPDLISRLRLSASACIDAPDPELLKAVLLKLFADRQISIDADVVAYAARHCEQSLEAISRFVEAVDETALERRRRITRPLAAATIAMLQGHGPT